MYRALGGGAYVKKNFGKCWREPLSACVKMLINEKRKRKESEINDIELAGVIGIVKFYPEMNTNMNFWHGRLGLT